jgi:hypothetical protein
MATTTKPGWLTSEFFLTALAHLISLLYLAGAIGSNTPTGQIAALIATALTNAGYSVARGNVKAAAVKGSAPDTLSATATVTKE